MPILHCGCGKKLRIFDRLAGRQVTCPGCGTIVDVPGPATPGPASPAPPADTIPCPFCGETVRATAKKCKHCEEFLNDPPATDETAAPLSDALLALGADAATAPAVDAATASAARNAALRSKTKPCPFCGETIRATAKKCKHCEEFLDDPSPGPASIPASAADSAPAPAWGPSVGQARNDGREASPPSPPQTRQRLLLLAALAAIVAVVVVVIVYKLSPSQIPDLVKSALPDRPARQETPEEWAKARFPVVDGHVDVHGRDQNGLTLAHYAASAGRIDVLEWMKKQGAGVDARNNAGQTPMFDAASNGQIEAMAWLKEHGANVNGKTNNGRFPLDVAKDEETKAWLRANGGRSR